MKSKIPVIVKQKLTTSKVLLELIRMILNPLLVTLHSNTTRQLYYGQTERISSRRGYQINWEHYSVGMNWK